MTDGALPPRIRSKFLVQPDGCWIWTAAQNQYGYGMCRFEGTMHAAHRVVYVLLGGTFTDRRHAHHVCRKKACVNPDHIEWLTPSEHAALHPNNNRSYIERMRHRTHCLRGHEMTPENTRIKNGLRKCRVCSRTAERARRRELSLG